MKNYIDPQLAAELTEFAAPAELNDLMQLAGELHALAQPELSPAGEEATWRGLSARQSAGNRRARLWRRWQFIGIPALMALTIGVVVLAQGAAPATPLYGVKRMSENAQLAVTFKPESKAQLCARYMKRRANELAALPAGQSPAVVASLTDDITAEAIEYVQYANQSGAAKTHEYTHLRLDALAVTISLESAARTQTGASQTASIKSALKYMTVLTLPSV